MNIFEVASREKFRFSSNKGMISVENLWDMPLQSRSGFDLDSVAKAVNAELKGVTEESFVATESNPAKAPLEIKLEIVKHVIAAKQAENAKARSDAAKKAEREKLMALLEEKDNEALKGLTRDEILEKMSALT